MIKEKCETRHRLAVAVLAAAAFAFNWFYLTSGFSGDDFILINLMEQDPLPYARWLGPWSFCDLPCFERLWFVEIDQEVGFWRPVPGLIMEGSLALFGRTAFPLHLLSLLLHAGVTVSLYFLVFRLLRNRGLAFLAALFFVACEDHSMTVGWISTITDLCCVQASLVALLFWLSWLRRRKPLSLIAALAALAVACGCKESAAAAPLALSLLGLLMPDGEGGWFRGNGSDDWGEGFRARLRRGLRAPGGWGPPLIVLIAYIVSYKAFGMGGLNTLFYTDPFADPLGFLGGLVLNMPIIWLATLSPVPPSLTFFVAGVTTVFAVAGTVAAILFAAGFAVFRRYAVAVWAGLLYLVALLPQLGTEAAERLLYFPMIFGAILLALAAACTKPVARRVLGAVPPANRLTRIVGWWILAGVLLPGVLFSAIAPYVYVPQFALVEKQVRTLESYLGESYPGERDPALILVNAPGPLPLFYVNDVLTFARERPTEAWVLSAACAQMTVERTGETSFVLRADGRGWLTNMFARVVRSEEFLEEGRIYDRKWFSATLVELTPDRRDVLAVRFDMKQPFDDRRVAFFHWYEGVYVPFHPASIENGGTRELADTSGAMDLF